MNIKKNLIDKIFLVIILLASISPQFNAIDNISIRWLLFSFFSAIYLLVTKIKVNKYFFLLFILFLAPIFLPINIELYLTEYLRIILLTTLFYLILNSLNNISKPLIFVCNLFAISLSIEALYLIVDFIINPDTFTGISMNRNISSFSIILKLPLFIYLINQENLSTLKKNAFNLIHICSVIGVIILQSRLAILLLPLIYLSIFCFTSFKIKQLFLPIVSILFSFILLINSTNSVQTFKSFFQLDIFNDISLNQRVKYYLNALEMIKEKPILGNGLGSWKVDSLRFSEYSGEQTLVPYYVHNDFMQLFVEIGIIGFLTYIVFLFFIFRLLIKKKFSNKIFIFLFISLCIYLADTSFNFPFYRPQEILPFLFISSIILFKTSKNFLNFQLSRIGNGLLILILLLIVILNFREHKSLIDQKILLADYYNKSYTIQNINLNNITYKFPSLASNTVPISSLIARYYLENKNFEKARELLNHSKSVNQYDLLTKELNLQYNLETYNFSEALLNANELFELSNNNEAYAELYFSIASALNLKEVFELSDLIYSNSNFNIHKIFYENYILLQNYDKKFLADLLMISLNLFPEEKYLYDLQNSINQ